jgi:hypothetical protein
LSESEIGSLEVSGSANLRGATISGTSSIRGSADLRGTTIGGMSEIHGSLNAKNSTLGMVEVHSEYITLFDSKTKAIRVIVNKWREAIVRLINTTVEGDIEFYGGDGKVYLEGDSRVTGKVSGGEIVKD